MKRYGTAILSVLLIIGILFFLSGGIFSHHSSKKDRNLISQNVSDLSVEENEEVPQISTSATATTDSSGTEAITSEEDLDTEQEKILSMAQDDFDNAALTRRFKNCVIVGDSIAHAGLEYGWLSESNYSAANGISIATGEEEINAAISAAPSVMFLNFGVNDIENYVSDVDSFISDYRDVLTQVQSGTSSTQIWVCALFPPKDGVEETKTFYQYLDEYNADLKALCEEMNVNYIDCGFLLEDMPELYDADDIHPVSQFYPLWFTYLADVAGLPNE